MLEKEKKLKPCGDDVLAYLMEHGSITVREGQEALGITEVRSRISELKAAGFHIDYVWETGKSRRGAPVRHKRWFLEV